MDKIVIHSTAPISITAVSNKFIDKYLPDADGEFVKIYLYLLRLLNKPSVTISTSAIADKFNNTEKDVLRALKYWERLNLLRLEYDNNQNLIGICLCNLIPESPHSSTATQKTQILPPTTVHTESAAPAKKSYSNKDVAYFRKNESIAELFFIAERYLGRTLNNTDTNTFLYLYDVLGFSPELIEYLIEYCASKNHTNIRYIEKVAITWAKQHITTVDEAKQNSPLLGKTYYTVLNAFGIKGRKLVSSELIYLRKWIEEYNFTDEIIKEACKRTTLFVHRPNFKYADSILLNWHKAHVHNLADIEKIDALHQSPKADIPSSSNKKNKFNNFHQRSYDFDEIEKLLLTTDPSN